MSPVLAHRVISLPHNDWVAFGVKWTSTRAGHAARVLAVGVVKLALLGVNR